MSSRSNGKLWLAVLWVSLYLSGCGFSNPPANSSKSSTKEATNVPWEQPVTKATCGEGDAVEIGLQGQVTLVERYTGFKGTHCNLELVGQWAGEGASWQQAWFGDCAYYGQAADRGIGPALKNPGTVVIDASDSAHPIASAYLATTSMLDPWESLKVNEKRKLLGSVNGTGGSGGPEFDVYDLSSDCAHPKLLSSTSVANSTLLGHEGNWAPDGLTYYGSDNTADIYYAIDVTNPSAPNQIAEWHPPAGGIHGLSVSEDGNRGYFVSIGGFTPTTDLNAQATNGFYILDTSEVQARKEKPEIKIISSYVWKDGSTAQHTLPITINNKPFLIHVDELGPGGVVSPASWISSCTQGLPPYGFARIFDISDETKPLLAAKMMLQTHDPANCWDVIGDTAGTVGFGYDSHYCSVDDPSDTKIMACSYFNSGLRVFDIRDPYQPKEIAYYNPPAKLGYQAGSSFNLTGICGTADFTTAMPRIRMDKGEIWFTSHCNGFQIVKFTKPISELLGSTPEIPTDPVPTDPVGATDTDRSKFGGALGTAFLIPFVLLGALRRRRRLRH